MGVPARYIRYISERAHRSHTHTHYTYRYTHMLAIILTFIVALLLITAQARDAKRYKAERLGMNVDILGINASLEFAEALLADGW